MNGENGAPSSSSARARARASPCTSPGAPRSGSWRAPTPKYARIGTMNGDGAVVGQPSRLSSRACRPRRILGRDAPAAGGTPAPLPRGSWVDPRHLARIGTMRRGLESADACPTVTRFMERASCAQSSEESRPRPQFSRLFWGIAATVFQHFTHLSLLGPEVFGDGFGARTDVKLAVDIADVGVDGLKADGECIGDLLVRVSLGQQVEDFPFSRGQVFGGCIAGIGLMEGLDDFCGDVARHGSAFLMDLLDGLQDFRRR